MPPKPPKLLTRKMFANLFLLCSGILFYTILTNWGSVRESFFAVYRVFSPFFIGFGLAYLLNLPLSWFERVPFRRLKRKRALSISCTYLLTLLVLYALASLVFPQVWESVTRLVSNLQFYLDNLTDWVNAFARQYDLNIQSMQIFTEEYEKIMKSIASALSGVMPQLVGISISFGKGVVSTFTAVFFSIYCLADKERLLFQCHKLIYAFIPPKRTERLLEILRHSNSVFAGFISGKLIDSLIIGVLCFVGMQFIHPELAMLISVVIGLTNVIPVFGPFIGAIPSIFLLLMVDPVSALWFTLFILLLQQLDGNIIGPKILGNSTGLGAIWVLVSIVVGGGLFGFVGMLLGVPVFSVLYYLGSDAISERLARRGLRVNGYRVEPNMPAPESTQPNETDS